MTVKAGDTITCHGCQTQEQAERIAEWSRGRVNGRVVFGAGYSCEVWGRTDARGVLHIERVGPPVPVARNGR